MFKYRNMLNEIENLNNLSNKELFDFLFEIIGLSELASQNSADNFINYLTDCPAPVREAVAYKLEDLIKIAPDYFKSDIAKNKMINAISDINPNVSRSMCNIIAENEFVSEMLIDDIILKINEIIAKIKDYETQNKDFFQNKIKNKKNHAKNKLLFSLYWYLESLCSCNINNHEDKILRILNYTINFCDYTIREKTAKLLTKFNKLPDELLQKAKSDQNFYVKIQVYDKMKVGDLN